MSTETKIKCPKCKEEIDVNNILYNQLKSELQSKFNTDLQTEKSKIEKQNADLQLDKEEFEKKKQKENELFQERLHLKLKEEKSALEISIKATLAKESAEQFESLQKELNEKSLQVKELNNSRAEIEKLKREKEEVKSIVEAESQKILTEALHAERDKIRKQEQDKNELEKRELVKQLDDQKKLTEEMRRKQEQGSVQLHGEVQELAIEEWLRGNFPLDTVVEVKKGARGADCRHVVNSRLKENCGSIYYESKRTKEFGKGWVEKFKNDIRLHEADIGILVTDMLPQGMDRMGLKEGVWICTYEEFKGLSFVMREHITTLDSAIASQENKGDKMVMLYDYLTSNAFKLQVEGIIEGYTQMNSDLESEKRSMIGLWKKRETQLKKVLNNTNFMYSTLRGIAGNAIQTITLLELPESADIVEIENE